MSPSRQERRKRKSVDILTLDFETYYAQDYALGNMTTEAYIRDPRFETILCGVKWNDTPSFWLLPARLAYYLQNEVDWPDTALVTHHAHFDGFILSHHYNVRPALHIDTLSMARVLDGPKAGNSLHDLCIRHGVGAKGDFVTYAKGKHGKDFTRAELFQYGDYCCNDCDRTYDLANKFLPQIPEPEIQLIDCTVRMFTEPVFIGDTEKLRGAVASERQRKTDLLRRINLLCPTCSGTGLDVQLPHLFDGTQPDDPKLTCKKCGGTGVDKKPIGSNDQFAALLRGVGIEPETKPSPTSGAPIMAFAKTDSFMQGLLEDEDEEVRFLAEARIGVKSNIILTRAQRFLECAERGPTPVYLKYGGAHTLRWSGGDSMNWQNMSNDIENAPRPEMAVLKQSIQAPVGHKIVAADSGQGEARILSWLANQHDLTEAFAQGRDVYSEAASVLYGRTIDRKKVKADYIPGQVGKIEILSFGFGSGWYTASMGFLKGVLGAPPIQFKAEDMQALAVDPSPFLNNPNHVARVAAMPSRLELNDRLIHCAVTKALVDRYRARYLKITGRDGGFWQTCEQAIGAMIDGREMVFGAHGVLRTGKECIYLPNQMKLNYRGLERSDDGNASYFDGRQRTKIYGSLLTENFVQCLHRIVVAEQMLEIGELIRPALMTHDDVVVVVPEDAAQMTLQFMIQVMKKAPAWAVGLPLTAEGGIGSTYAEAK